MNKAGNLTMTKAQERAKIYYLYCLDREEKYLDQAVVDFEIMKKKEAETEWAYQKCLSMGLTHKHGI